jgi:flavin reductase (DIM6/NTAB) family NADH-FMN oxidoreductase RutF
MTVMGSPRVHDKVRAGAISPVSDSGDNFRLAMREFASGVCIIAAGAGDSRSGCTATAVASFSLDPPTLVVCLNRSTSTLGVARHAGAFSVNILADRHQHLAKRFADRSFRGAERFDQGDWVSLVTGAPVLADALAAIDCRVEEVIERHTHAILIGAVEAVRVSDRDPALLHWRSRFETLE